MASKNMPDWLKESIFGAVVSVIITIGIVIYEKKQQASAGVTIPAQTLSLSQNPTFNLTSISGLPGSVTGGSSSNTNVATVSGTTVTAVAQGTAVITVNWSGGSATMALTVTA